MKPLFFIIKCEKRKDNTEVKGKQPLIVGGKIILNNDCFVSIQVT